MTSQNAHTVQAMPAPSATAYEALANAVLILHCGVALFVVGGLVATLAGGIRRWGWVRNAWFRSAHLAAILVVVMESWTGIVCPLTSLEQWLRVQAGQGVYRGDFIAYWLSRLLFFDAPAWVFIAVYCAFAGVVVLSWILVPPRRARVAA